MRAATLGALVTSVAASLAAEHVLLPVGRMAVVDVRAAALIMSGQEGGDLPIAAGLLPGADGATTVVVEIDGAALLEAAADGPVAVDVFAYLLGAELEVLAQDSLSVDVDPAAHRPWLAGTGLKVFLGVEAAAEGRLLRVLARAGEAFGLRGVELAAGQGPRLLRPAFLERQGAWLLAAARDVVLPPPFGFEATSPLPAVQPPLAAGDPIPAQIFARGAPAGPWDLRALFRDRAGEVVETPVEIVERTAGIGGFETAAVSFTAPRLSDGLYEMALALTPADAGARPAATVRSGFVAVFVESTAPSSAAATLVDAGATAPPVDPAESRLARQVGTGYREALRRLAAGERSSALTALSAIETRVFEAVGHKALNVLRAFESRALAPLADSDWGSALPVMLLHFDASSRYQAERHFVLAHHARQMTVDLANAYSRKLGTPEAAGEAAAAVASLAGQLQTGGALSQAETLFRHALSLAPQPTAWLGLGTILEKRGMFRQAIEPFESFVDARPDHMEGRLRLALNRARSGRIAEARADLERLAAAGSDGWIQLLACQELARLELDQGRPQAAAGVLRRALLRWPGHPTLTVQLAYVQDAEGATRAAAALLAALDLADDVHPATERSRYNRWPQDVLHATRLAFETAAESRLGDLGRWLDGPAAADGG